MSYQTWYIPANYTDAGKLFGIFAIRNTIEAVILAGPCIFLCLRFLPFSITTNIIITMIAGIPLGGFALIGVQDDSYIQYIAPKKGHLYNDHMIVWGASGTGKSRGVIKPFILKVAQRMESIVLMDTKGELYESTAEYMKSKGYLVRAYNLLDLDNSDGFNCIYDIEQDPELVRSVAEIIIQNTSNAKDRQNFWETAEKNLLTAMLHYMGSVCDDNGLLLPIEQRSLGAIYNMLASERFDKIAKRIDNLTAGHPAKAPFDLIRETPVQNRANIVMGLGNRLGVFQNRLVDCITKYNDIDLALPGQRPCAYYCICYTFSLTETTTVLSLPYWN